MKKAKNTLIAMTLSAATILSGCTPTAAPESDLSKEQTVAEAMLSNEEADKSEESEKTQNSTEEESPNAETSPESEPSSKADPALKADSSSTADSSLKTDSSADIDMYSDILDMYYYQLENQVVYDDFYVTAPVDAMATYAYSKDGYDKAGALDYSGYTFTDLNGDGVNELVIGNLSDDEKLDKMIYAICTVHNNVPYGAVASNQYEKYYICEDNKILKEGGYDDVPNERSLYEFAADGLGTDLIEGVKCDKDLDGNATWNRIDAYENKTEISEADAVKALDEYKSKRIQVQLTPFSKYTPINPVDTYDGMAGTAFGKGFSSWQEGYLAYLNEHRQKGDNEFAYALIYVDNDDVPELVVDTGFEAGGCQILSYYDGTVSVFQTSRLYFTYIEKSGLLCNSDGHMGYYYDYVYELKNGNWKSVFKGDFYDSIFNEESDNSEENEETLTFCYEVDGRECDEDTYNKMIDEIYDRSEAKIPDSYYLIDDMLSYFSTGKMYSEGHRYELIVEDCTWEEADRRCKEKGGYLASLTCDEEFETIDNLIRQQGLEKICFFIGANRIGDHWWHWTEPELTQNRCTGNGYRKHWIDGWPSDKDTLADGTEVEEEYAEYIYRKDEDTFYMNDVPNDVIGLYPSFKGGMGYICEYAN